MAKNKETGTSGAATAVLLSLLLAALACATGFIGLEAYHQRGEIRELRVELEKVRSGANELVGTYVDKVRDLQKADIREQVEALGAGIRSEVEKARGEAATKDELAKVGRRIDEVASVKGADFALLTSAALLKDKVERGASFGDELAMVEAAGGSQEAVKKEAAVLAPLAGGVKSAAELGAEFGKIADDVAFAANNPAGSKPNMLKRFWLRAKGLVKVRKLEAGNDDGSADAIIARVEELLVAGDVAGAAEEFGRLAEVAPEGLAAGAVWNADAKASADAFGAVSRLYSHALVRAAGTKTK
ncbi:MAG: hypothetical protein LBI17_03330 [Rickettsiales bacterium]|jgi:hypothetical protein|nr:hypothetical protein [Rickettsiales bacterium]